MSILRRHRIFISIHYLELGGAERALIGLLNALDKASFDIDLFVYSHQGELMSSIPAGIRLLPEEPAYSALERPIKDILREGHLRVAWGRIKAKYHFRQYMKKSGNTDGSAIFQYVADYTTPYLPSLEKYGEYDLAISFLTPHNIVLEKINAKRKVAWIHTDYSYIQVDVQREKKVWLRYDYIASISDSVTDAFLKTFPEAKSKIVLVENILSAALVRKQAEAFDVSNEMPREDGVVRLLSVGRFSYPKNFDNVPNICRRLRDLGVNAKWYIIGFGGDEDLIRQRVGDEAMDGNVILLGKKENPYPYMAACDIYVQPSRYEGKAVTVREAQMLCKPVVITSFPTSKSQLKDGVDGVIVPLDNDGCARGLAEAIRNKEKLKTIVANLHAKDYGNEGEARMVEQLANV